MGEVGGEVATCLFSQSCLTSASLCGHLSLICFFGSFVFSSPAFLGLVPVCLFGPSMDSGEGDITPLLALPPLIFIFIFIFPLLSPSKRWMEGCSPRSSLNLFSFSNLFILPPSFCL